MRKFLHWIGSFFLGFLIFQVLIRAVARFFHYPAPPFITPLLNSRLRERWQPADVVLERSRVSAGKKVLEVGSGGGYFLPRAAARVGETGKVYALDISPEMIRIAQHFLFERAPSHFDRVEFLERSAYDLPFDDDTLDVVYFVGSLMEIPHPDHSLKAVYRVLKPGGTVSITEVLPDPDYPGVYRSAALLKAAGYKIIDLSGNFMSYTITAVKL
jgi:ubiquinone/menaquinone biosynthesis C-methylase UbiE